MNKIITKYLFVLIVCFITITQNSFAQSPQRVSYQAIVRNSSSALVVNTLIGMRVRILQGSVTGTPIYTETHKPTSNSNGLVSIEIGGGTVVSGDFAAIDWAAGPYFVKTEMDPTGGNTYTVTGTSQLLSVPYALHAKTAESILGGGGGSGGGGATYSVGDFAMGGVVFWVDASGQHGLVCNVNNIPSQLWRNVTAKNTFTTGDGAYAGEMNTVLQVASQANDDASVNFAAKACANYSIEIGGALYGDWYLPSKWELNKIYEARTVINNTSIANGGTALYDGFNYWSSTELDANNAWLQNFGTGTQGADSKHYNLEIRPVRSF